MPHPPQKTLAEWLAEAPFSLALSSGYFGFFAHCGVMLALEEAGLVPAQLAGSSAGALVAGCFGAGLSATEISERLHAVTRADFWDPFPGFGLLRGRKFRQHLHQILPGDDLSTCKIPVAVSVFDVFGQKTEVRRRGSLAAAIQASCALPGLFQPVRLDGRYYWDGGVLDRPGLSGVRDAPRVFYHHLASRSPWRRKNGAHTKIPARPGLVALAITGLPRSGPFALAVGPQIIHLAQAAATRALRRPVGPVLRESSRPSE